MIARPRKARGESALSSVRRPLSGALLALGVAFLCACDSPKGEATSPTKDLPQDRPVLVRLGEFERGDIYDRLPVSADLEAVFKSDVFPEIAGPVAEVLRRMGDPVEKGEVVVRLVDEHLRLAVEQKKILAAQAAGKVRLADLARREGGQTVRQKQFLLEKAQREHERVKMLSEDPQNGLISPQEADAKRYELEEARIAYQTCLLQVEKFELDHAQALESEKLANVEQRTAEYALSQATLKAPLGGRLTYLEVKPGEMVSASTRAFTVVDPSRMEARLHVPQKDLARMKPGLPVRILCEVFPEKEFRGEVEVVSPVVDKQNGTVEVRVGVSDPKEFLKPGMFVSGEIILETHPDALLVTKKAVSYEDREPIVFLVQDGVARRYVLKPGFSTRDRIEVLGLSGPDGKPVDPSSGRLVVVGHNNLKEGSPVEVE